jgi:hypothetical protein
LQLRHEHVLIGACVRPDHASHATRRMRVGPMDRDKHGAAAPGARRCRMVDRMYAWQGRAHAALAGPWRDERGQGTVEYVGLILLIAVILAGVVKATNGFTDGKAIAGAVVDKLKEAIKDVGGGK